MEIQIDIGKKEIITMEKSDKKFRALAIAAICIAIVGVSVAYAALSTILNVNGTATVSTSTSWKIQFNNISTITTTGNASTTREPALNSADSTILEWAAKFSAPGDSVSFTFQVKNGGSIDAVLDEVTKTIADANASVPVASYFTYDVTVGGQTITDGLTEAITKRILKSTNYTTVSVKVTFDAEGNIKTSETLEALDTGSVNFTLKLGFSQATSSDTYEELA